MRSARTAAPRGATFTFDTDLTIRSWSAEAEKLTGISAQEAVGQPCWQVVRGIDADWKSVCHAGCVPAQSEQELLVRTRQGRRLLTVSTTVADAQEPLFVHALRRGRV